MDVGADPPGRWHTPTGDPCPRVVRVDGTVVGCADCVGCGFCLLLAGLVELDPPRAGHHPLP